MVRNRLIELQAQAKHAPITEEEERVPLQKEEKRRAKEGKQDGLESFDVFLARYEGVVQKIDKVKENAQDIHGLQRSLLLATHKDEPKESRMNDLIHENKGLAESVRTIIKRDQASLESKTPTKLSLEQKQEHRIKTLQVNTHSKRFYDIWNQYNNQQMDFRDKSKSLLVKRCKITNKDLTEDQIETMLDEGNTAMFAKSILDQENMARQQLSDLTDRHDELIKLERSIKEVYEMFLEIANLVSQQGEMVDNIEMNIVNAGTNVEAGKGHLKKAEELSISARKKKVCLFSVLAVLILIVLIVILVEFGAFSGGGESSTETRTIIEERVVYVTQTTTTTTTTPVTTQPPTNTTAVP